MNSSEPNEQSIIFNPKSHLLGATASRHQLNFSPSLSANMAEELLDLNKHCGGNAGANAWESPTLTGMHRLPPHSTNILRLAQTHRHQGACPPTTCQEWYPSGPHPCVCLNSSNTPVGAVRAYANMSDQHSPSKHAEISSKKGWQFRLFEDPNSIPKGYVTSTKNARELSFCSETTSVPSNWTMQSHRKCCGVHDPPWYTNVQMPFDVLYPHVPKANPTGVYRLEFSALPTSWISSDCSGRRICRRVVLHLGGAESCFFVYMNGQFVGMGKDSKLPSEFDVTPYVHHEGREGTADKNVLAVVVLKWCDGSFLEQQDHWRWERRIPILERC